MTVELTLVGDLSVVEGEATLRIPLVVAPRYVPGAPLDGPSVGAGTAVDTAQVPDASRVTPPVLLQGFPNPVALSVEVELHPGDLAKETAWRDEIQSSLHSVQVNDNDPCKIRLLPGERVNRDFILRFPVLPSAIHSSLQYTHFQPQQAGTFALTLLPPAKPASKPRPRDVVFVLDRSGSMCGWKMAAARRAVARIIDSLREEDRFRLLAFDDRIETPLGASSEWQPATDRNRWHAAEWIAKIEARGGTELGGALRTAVQQFATFGTPQNRDAILVLITDGQVAGEDSVLRTLGGIGLPRLPRIFTVGIDRAVNSSMLTRLAEMGGGNFELVESEERLDQVMDRLHRDIGTPVLTDLKIEPIDLDLVHASVTPQRLPDVFVDRPVTIYGRVAGQRQQIRLRVTARRADGTAWEEEVTAKRTAVAALLPLWGRSRVRDMEDRLARGDRAASGLQTEIIGVSLESHVLSRFTAYVAVDLAEVVNEGGSQHQILQPVEEPEGWELRKSSGKSTFRKSRRSRRAFSFAPPSAAPSEAAGLVPESVARENNVMPVAEKDGRLLVRMSDPNDFEAVERLRFILNREIDVEVASASEIQDAINGEYGQVEGESADSMMQEFTDTAIDFTETDEDRFEDLSEDSAPIVRMVQLIVSEAVQLRASHVYLCPDNDRVVVTYIIDGASTERDCLPRRLLMPLVSRLRRIARINGGPYQLQAGEVELDIGKASHKVQVYIVPTGDGPSVVLRLTNQIAASPDSSDRPTIVDQWLNDAQRNCDGDPRTSKIYQRLLDDSQLPVSSVAGDPLDSA